jgi:hypothetical protein
LLTACSAVTLAACGGGEGVDRRVDPGPPIERSTAEQLAARSDEVARLLEAGDACGATAAGERLREELTAAINRAAIPELYLEDLSGAVNEIQVQLPRCEREAQVPPPPRDDREKKPEKPEKPEKLKEHKNGNKDEGDD